MFKLIRKSHISCKRITKIHGYSNYNIDILKCKDNTLKTMNFIKDSTIDIKTLY